MSHVRNLLNKFSGAEKPPPIVAGAVAVAPEDAAVPRPAAAPPCASPEFQVEEAHFTPSARLVYYDDPRSPAADCYRLLRMRLKEHWGSGKLRKLLVTGALAHDGKSTVILNLATALAERGRRTVLVVEADLHHSSLAETLKLKPWAGLAECLVDNAIPPLSAIRRIEPLGWHFLPAGEPRPNPTELLQTPAFGKIINGLSPFFDWILIDSPPVISVTDSLSLQQHTDGTLFVVRAGQTPREAVEEALALLGKDHVLGMVLNAVEARNHLSHQYKNYENSRRYQED